MKFLSLLDVNIADKLETVLTKAVKIKGNPSLVRKLLKSEQIDPN